MRRENERSDEFEWMVPGSSYEARFWHEEEFLSGKLGAQIDKFVGDIFPPAERGKMLVWALVRSVFWPMGHPGRPSWDSREVALADLYNILGGNIAGGLVSMTGNVVNVGGPQVYRYYTSAENCRKILAEKRFKPNPDNSRVYFTTPDYYSNVPAEIEGAINVVSDALITTLTLIFQKPTGTGGNMPKNIFLKRSRVLILVSVLKQSWIWRSLERTKSCRR